MAKCKGDVVSYAGAHTRVRRKLGPAKNRLCVDCGQRAAEWSYNHQDPNEITGPCRTGGMMLVYSTDPDHYEARCKPCHRLFDVPVERNRDTGHYRAKLSSDQVATIFSLYDSGLYRQREIAATFGVSHQLISWLNTGRRQ